MGKMQLKNLENASTLNCILWEETINRIPEISTRIGNIIKITTGSYNEKYNNCLITNFDVLEQAILGLEEDKRQQYFDKLIETVEAFKNDELRNFVLDILISNKDKLLVAPAAKQMHHNYIGGLLVHTVECVDILKSIFPNIKKNLNYDETMAAAILHDIGKLFEYDINVESGVIDYNEQFLKDWLSHSQYGYSLCMSKGFKKIAKMIASHHGRADWGAMIDLAERDLEPFYYIIHHVDDLSAKFGMTSVNDLKNI